jgi:hypothetical protein
MNKYLIGLSKEEVDLLVFTYKKMGRRTLIETIDKKYSNRDHNVKFYYFRGIENIIFQKRIGNISNFTDIYANYSIDGHITKGNKELEKLKGGQFYQTCGYGVLAERGYVILPNNEIYVVERGWSEPFKIVRKFRGRHIIQNENAEENLYDGIKIIRKLRKQNI